MRLVHLGSHRAGLRRASHPARLTAGVAAAVVSVLLAGCHLPGMSSSAAAPATTTTVTVAAAPQIGDAPLYMAIKDGLLRKAGLHVRTVRYPSFQAEITALDAGKADLAFGGYASLFYAQALANTSKAPSLAIVAEGYDAAPSVMEVLTLPGSHIDSPSGLTGKAIGTPEAQMLPTSGPHYAPGQPYSLATVATQSVLTNDNVDPAKISWTPMPTQSLISALAHGKVQAILATEPTIYAAESQLGAVPVLDSSTGATANLPLDGYFSLRTFAQTHQRVIAAFRSAMQQAQAAAGQAAPVQAVLESLAKMSPQTATLVTLGQYPTSVSIPDLQRIINLMFFFNALPAQGKPNAAKMIAP